MARSESSLGTGMRFASGAEPILNQEKLSFDHVHLAQRSYK
jgi:hypothetical protein